MALYSRDKDNKKAAREAIREGRQEARARGREARDESLAAGEPRKQARAKKRQAKKETPEDKAASEDLMQQVIEAYGEQRAGPAKASPDEMRRASPGPRELGVTQEEAASWVVNPPAWIDAAERGWTRNPDGSLASRFEGESTSMTPEQIAEMEAEVARTDQEAEEEPAVPRPEWTEERKRY